MGDATVEQRLAVIEDLLMTLARDVACTCPEPIGWYMSHFHKCARAAVMDQVKVVVARHLGRDGRLNDTTWRELVSDAMTSEQFARNYMVSFDEP